MIEKVIIGILCAVIGFLIARLITHLEVSSIKSQLQELDEENEKLTKENTRLREHNSKIYDKLIELHSSPSQNTPSFDEW